MTDLSKWKITPTEELILEVLTARTRLGHNAWTFARNGTVGQALDKLARHGFVEFKHGVAQDTYLVWWTDEGQKFYMTSTTYVPPIQGGPL